MADQPGPLDDAMRAPLPSLLDADQVELFRDQVPGRDAATAVEALRRSPRGRGRPAGALNRRNAQLRDYILARYPHPAIGFAETYSRPVEVLAAELGCTKLEAAKLQHDARAELLPFLEQKLAAVNVKVDREDVVIIMAGQGQDLEAVRERLQEGGVDGLELGWDDEAAPIEGECVSKG